MGEIEINFDGFHVTHLISDYSGTLYDIDFNPKERYTDIQKFLVELRMHLHITLVECLYKIPALRVFFSIAIESGMDTAPFLMYETVNSRGRCITEDGEVEDVIEQLFLDVIKCFADYKNHIPQLKINILLANIHIVAVTDNYLNLGPKSLQIVGCNRRFGHKFRAALAMTNCSSMCLLYTLDIFFCINSYQICFDEYIIIPIKPYSSRELSTSAEIRVSRVFT